MAQHNVSEEGPEVRVGQGGLAFAVGIDGAPGSAEISLDSSVSRGHDSGESALTAEQLELKLAAAEARRQAALDEVRNKGAEEASKVEKASETRQQAVDELKEVLDMKADQAQSNQDAHRQAILDKLHAEEAHHVEVLGRRAKEFHKRVQDMDQRQQEKDGKRHAILEEMVNKVKEHNDRVQEVHDEITAHRKQERVDADKEAALRKKWMDASSQRDVYLSSAETRLRTENLE